MRCDVSYLDVNSKAHIFAFLCFTICMCFCMFVVSFQVSFEVFDHIDFALCLNCALLLFGPVSAGLEIVKEKTTTAGRRLLAGSWIHF